MNISSILDIEGGIRSFFSSLSVSLSFNLMFIIGLSVELALILFFVIKSYYSYEIRTTKALDRLNKWLFVNKKLTTENIKEFTNLVKSCPKRLSYNWQQFILYREKAPSEYLTMDNIIEKPLRASSFDSNIKNMGIFSYIFSAIMLVMGLAHSGAGETVLNTYLVIVALSIPFLMLLMYGIARICLMAKKHSNLDTLYQNLHLFQRFIDNACIDLPPFIDFTLLFSVEEIEKGIPALREFLESRARKEKEEFDKARSEMVEYEKYDFEKAGIDGSNILDRAMKETETYLSNKNKTLAKISQIEAALESLKKNFDNIQKEFQRKMQVSKENIDRLRQSQEETTSRIESNFLRKQQMAEITKQEKEESDFEQQKRRYLVEKNDYEEEIKNLNSELDNGKNDVEKAMLAEYQTFYTRVCQKAAENVNSDMQSELSNLKELSENTEEDLAQAQTVIKRLEDENLTLRKKLNSDENNEIESYKIEAENNKDKKSKKSKPVVEEYSFDEAEDEEQQIEENPTKKEEVEQEAKHAVNIPQPETYSFDEEVQYDNSSESQENKVIDRKEDTNELSENKNASRQAIYENLFNENYDYEEVYNNDEETFNYDEEDVVDDDKEVPLNQDVDVMSEKKKRGRPVGSVKAKPQIETVKRGRGRPKKEKIEPKEKRGRGRPVGSTQKVNSPSVKNRNSKTKQKVTLNEEKRGRGRPRKNTSIETINSKIKAEEQKALKAKNKADNQINKAIKGIDNSIKKEQERQRLIAEIEELRRQTQEVSDSSPEELEKISHKVEALLKRIEELED